MSTRQRTLLTTALAAAVFALLGSVGYVATTSYGSSPAGGSMMGSGLTSAAMMGGSTRTGSMMGAGMGMVWLLGDGTAVTSIPAARARAGLAAAPVGLHPGEIIRFDNGYYVELKDSTGAAATEVIVSPADGTVTTEPGPAMMWNTRYGMHGQSPRRGATTVSQDRAKTIAQAWLDAHASGTSVLSVDFYPGYYTADIGRNGTIAGMLSVNATSGQVWFHTWHGTFIARDDA